MHRPLEAVPTSSRALHTWCMGARASVYATQICHLFHFYNLWVPRGKLPEEQRWSGERWGDTRVSCAIPRPRDSWLHYSLSKAQRWSRIGGSSSFPCCYCQGSSSMYWEARASIASSLLCLQHAADVCEKMLETRHSTLHCQTWHLAGMRHLVGPSEPNIWTKSICR